MNTAASFAKPKPSIGDYNLYSMIPTMPNCDGFMPVVGDKLHPSYRSGDVVFFKKLKDKQNMQWGELHIVRIQWPSGEPQVLQRYVVQSDKAGYVWLFTEERNSYTGMEIALDRIIEVGHVRASLRIGQ